MEEVIFRDILLARGTACGIFKYMTRSWDPKKTMVLEKHNSPEELKDIVNKSVFMDSVIEVESLRLGVRKETLKKEVLGYLEEMFMDKKLHVIRWMGVVFLKISFMMKIGVFVNESAMLKVRDDMGKNPVLFLPTHRSYADFCLITYLCYNYDIDFPAVAAGMDFYSMAVVGRRMRETGAFYIRRSLVGAPLYAATLKQYVRTLVAKHAAPVEFFLEGTRSRSNKSIPPKYGMLAMSLLSYFSREVSDVTIVPFNISYDRLMEHGLFAYEHLGVPKPKESTGGLLRSLHVLNDHFGNIYINAGAPISVKDYLKETAVLSEESLKPCDLQQLTPAQFEQVQDLANYVVGQQQANTVATISNLMAIVLMQSVMKGESLHYDEVVVEVQWIVQVLRSLGASVFETDVRSSMDRIMVVHNKMMTFDKHNKLRLLSSALMDVSPDVQKKMKGHILKAETMVNAVPIIQLQLYVNPVLHYIVPPAIVYLLVKKAPLDTDQLLADYLQVRRLLKHEFFYIDKEETTIFNKAVNYCLENNVIVKNGEIISPGINDRLQYLFKWSVLPALTTLIKCAYIMDEQSSCEHKSVQKQIQERVESSHCHPYCLSLEAIGNCLQGLVLDGAIAKDKREKDILYKVVPKVMKKSSDLIHSLLPELKVDFGGGNKVISNNRVASRL